MKNEMFSNLSKFTVKIDHSLCLCHSERSFPLSSLWKHVNSLQNTSNTVQLEISNRKLENAVSLLRSGRKSVQAFLKNVLHFHSIKFRILIILSLNNYTEQYFSFFSKFLR